MRLATKVPETGGKVPETGFKPGKSTIYRTLSFQMFVESCHKLGHKLLIAYIHISKEFDAVQCESLWEILRLRGTLGNIMVNDIDFSRCYSNWNLHSAMRRSYWV